MRLICFIILVSLITGCSNKKKDKPGDSQAAAIEQQVEKLLSQMTLEEKVAQLCATGSRKKIAIEEGIPSSQLPYFKRIENGIGSLENTFDPRTPFESATQINLIQKFLVDSTRLGIPAIIGSECLHGHAAVGSTIFPSAIAMACSWNPDMVNKVFDVTAREARLRGSTEAHTPVLDMGRDPRWGRIEETYGEDTYLTSRMAYAIVTGLQGGNNGIPGNTHIISSPKHFAGYGQVAGGRNFASTAMSQRTLMDEIMPPFKTAVIEAKAQGIMASHCDIDGVPAHANKWLLTDLLREKWGFDGIVVSDYNDIQRLHIYQHVAESVESAAEMALKAGMDLDLPASASYKTLTKVIEAKPELEEYLDNSVRRVLTVKYKLGLFDNPFVDVDECVKYVGSKENIDLALKMAEESIVLLKNNNNVLPLNKKALKSVAVIGPNATSTETGVYSMPSNRVVSILDGIKKELGNEVTLNYAPGCQIADVVQDENKNTRMNIYSLAEEEKTIQEAVKAAKQSDVAIVCVGGNISTSCEAVFAEGHLGDRSDITLLGNQRELIKRISNTGKPVIVVLMGGRPYAIPEVSQQSDAILSTFYCGEQAGVAISNMLFGKTNPSGKLCVSFPRSVGQIPVYYSQKEQSFYKNYLEETSRPLYPFGHGLSYTTFELSDLQIEKDTITKEDVLDYSVTIKNTGNVAGAEVVQVYFSDKYASVTRPEKLLVRFQKVFLEPGQEKTVEFSINPKEDLSFTGINYERVFEEGEFKLIVGNSSANNILSKSFFVF